jgi:diaminohydroxyphosphoribosylaminopyrimidine deaminase/5-amino-6-(5-phosphoribosylamino)uracil reductase
MFAPEDEKFMRQALGLARRAWGRTHPNPMVGAVIVEDGQVVAEGFHDHDGGPHAERLALAALGRKPGTGATMYVTMEPCSTVGRTGACTEAILNSGIRKLVVGASDPNPAHAGRGFEILRGAGIEVVAGFLEAECTELNFVFNHWITTGEPILAGKLAATLDGRIATRTGESKWITGTAARADVHGWRRLFPAIGVGAGTVMKDNPKLTSRIDGEPEVCPIRFVFDGKLRTVSDRNMPTVYTDEFAGRTTVVTTQHGGMGYVRKLRDLGVTVWIFESANGRVPMAQFRTKCASEGITGVFLEGGADLISRCIIERQLDYLFLYQAPVFLSDEKSKPVLSGLRTEKLPQALRLANVQRMNLGDDILVRGTVVYPEKLTVDETLFSLG